MAKIVMIGNQKGGVGKTATANSFAAGLALRGLRALAVDLDSQANLTDSIGAQRAPGIYDVMSGSASAADAVQHFDAFDIIAADISLAAAEHELGGSWNLRDALASLSGAYDYIIFDTPPNLGLMTLSALAAADEIIIPATPGIFEIAGIGAFCEAAAEAKARLNPGLEIAGVLFTRFSARTNLSREALEAVEEISELLSIRVFKTKIRSSVDIGEAQAAQESIYAYKKKSKAAKDYLEWIDEYLKGER